MSFGHPLLLLTLLVIPLSWLGWLLADRRRMRYAVRFTNVEVLAGVVGTPSRLRLVAPALLAIALASLGVAIARPHQKAVVGSNRAAVILVLDVSGSMQAQDVKPTRLVAAQRAIHTFLDKAPGRLRVGLILFAGEPVVATPPTTDHNLVRRAVDSTGDLNPFGGTAIGDAVALAVRLCREISNSVQAQRAALAARSLAVHRLAAPRRRPLVSILFLSDGHQNSGKLKPLQGAQRAKAAGFPVYTIALGTTAQTTLRGGGGMSLGTGSSGVGFGGDLGPDPRTLRQIAHVTGGKFFRAKTAGAVQEAYAQLGSELGWVPASEEITDEFVAAAAVLLFLACVASALWAPRLP